MSSRTCSARTWWRICNYLPNTPEVEALRDRITAATNALGDETAAVTLSFEGEDRELVEAAAEKAVPSGQ